VATGGDRIESLGQAGGFGKVCCEHQRMEGWEPGPRRGGKLCLYRLFFPVQGIDEGKQLRHHHIYVGRDFRLDIQL